MSSNTIISTDPIESWLLKLVEEGLACNSQRFELLSLSAARSLRSKSPGLASALGSMVAKFSGEASALRLRKAAPPPADADAGLALLQILQADDAKEPVFASQIRDTIERFVSERLGLESLLKEGITPPRSLLLEGKPGTGKTMLAKWVANRLNLPLVVLDLATSISSFLGKTGANLRRSLDYARASPCVLLLDEFDAIAKRRDDPTEVGELKRIVNVLLKELEDWPFHSVLVAATNHPELMDPAINRRFDVVIQLPLPSVSERQEILQRTCSRFAPSASDGFWSAMAESLDGCSGSDLETLSQSLVRRHLLERRELPGLFIEHILSRPSDARRSVASLSKVLKDVAGYSVREIGQIVGKSPSAVQYQLTKKAVKRSIKTKKV